MKCTLFKIFIVCLLIHVTGNLAIAQEMCPIAKGVRSYDQLRRIPVLDQGRVKPLDSYARSTLLQISGRSTYEKKPAIQWLARLIFDSGRSQEETIFLINNPQIVESLGIEPVKNRRYSYAQLQEKYETLKRLAESASRINEKDQDIVETEIIRVFSNFQLYSSLAQTFGFVFPHPDFSVNDAKLKEKLGLPATESIFSYFQIAMSADTLQRLTQPLERMEESKWSQQQQEVVLLASNLLKWSMYYKGMPLKIVPSYMPGDENWYSPWDSMMIGLRHQEGRNEIMHLRNILADYWDGRSLEFNLSVKSFLDSVMSRQDKKYRNGINRNEMEIFYNRLNPFFYAKVVYFFTFILFFVGLVFTRPLVRYSALVLLWIGFGLHLMGLGLRISILQRPPVSNLYETFIFVGIISAISGLVIEKMTKNWLGIAVASFSGYAFLSIASKFAAEGDTLQMLVAVLNSNFWLATHVTTITVGYAGTCVAGVVGHIYLLQAIFKSTNKKLLRSTYQVLLGTLGFGLAFAFLGTNLGGIWADQSWGRFWGWDPKENGALMIILWTALVFHAKIGKIIGPLGVAVGSIFGIIVVMWAWFGVNLLSVGLHSYGFTSGLATNLLIYLIAQLLFIAVAYPVAKLKIKR